MITPGIIHYDSRNLNWSLRLTAFFFPKSLKDVSSSWVARLTLSRLAGGRAGRRSFSSQSELKSQSGSRDGLSDEGFIRLFGSGGGFRDDFLA